MVDDASADDSASIAAEHADVVLRSEQSEGAAAARNRGAAVADAELLLFVDADVVVRGEAIGVLVGRIADGWDACFGAYGALPPPSCRNAPTLFKNLQQHWTHTTAANPVRSFWSGLGIVRADAFDAVGGFDLRATRGADVEDIDLGYRLDRAGFRICQAPAALGDHHKRYGLFQMVRSDVMHRAVPWVRTMARTGRGHAELNLAPAALAAALSLLLGLGAAGAIVGRGPSLFRGVTLAAGLCGWLAAHLRFFHFAITTAGARGLVVVPLQLLYGIYAPLGGALGLAAAVADRMRRRAGL